MDLQYYINLGVVHTPVTPTLGSQRQEDREFKVVLGYLASWRPA